MKLKTKQFGELEFNEDRIVKLPEGIIGFENLKDYLLIKTEDELFFWLNSIEEAEIVFPLFAINALDDSYPQVDENEVFGIVTLNPDPAKITVNLKAPVYINLNKMEGYQKILDTDKYSIDYNLFVEGKE
jgi:flagellar assembly factor FliW